VENIAREGVQNIHHGSKQNETGTKNGVAQSGSCRQCGRSLSVASSMDPSLHAVIKWIQIWRIWRSQMRWD